MASYKILVLGDSVAWGQGHIDRDKYAQLVASHVSKKYGKPAELIMLAHSGAKIGSKVYSYPSLSSKESKSRSETPFYAYLYGELPRLYPNLLTQIEIARGDTADSDHDLSGYLDIEYCNGKQVDNALQVKHKRALKTQIKQISKNGPDLVIMQGGINDMNPFCQVFAPYTTGSEFQDEINESRELMQKALGAILGAWSRCKILVCGYYPVFTAGSKSKISNLFVEAMATRFVCGKLPSCEPTDYIKRSKEWAGLSRKALEKAVDEANSSAKSKRVFFAQPRFGSDSGVFAENALLYSFKVARIKAGIPQLLQPYDSRENARKEAWDLYVEANKGHKPLVADLEVTLASMAHPNKNGAKAYAQAITTILDEKPKDFGLR